MDEPTTDPRVPMVIQIQMGGLAYIDRRGILFDHDLAESDFKVASDDQFVFPAGQDCGVFVLNHDPRHKIFCGMALMPSFAALRGYFPIMTYAQAIEDLRDVGRRDWFESTIRSMAAGSPRGEHAIANFRLAVQSPIWAPNLLADHILRTMGSDIEEFRIFGGAGKMRRATPEIVTALAYELQSRKLPVIVEESIVDLDSLRLIASVHPYADRPSDRVRSRGPVDDIDAIIGITEASVIRLAEKQAETS